jgi:hypothetical protein
MKITVLILHIVCAVLFGACAVIHTNMISEALNILASISWSICIGMDIENIIND